MNPVTAMAVGSVRIARSGERPWSTGASATALPERRRPGERSSCGSHTRRASPAGSAQIASAERQLPPRTGSSGAVSPEAKAAPTNSDIVYRPIISPARWAKSCLIAAGITTFPTAIAMPTSTVPANRAVMLGSCRSRFPAARTSSTSPSRRCMPSRRVRPGVRNANAPNTNTGIVVSRLTTVADRPSEARISPITGPIAATPMRRFSPIRISPTPSSSRAARPRGLSAGSRTSAGAGGAPVGTGNVSAAAVSVEPVVMGALPITRG